MEQQTSRLSKIKVELSRIREQMNSIQRSVDDITLSDDDDAALKEYLDEKSKGTLLTQEEVDSALLK